MYDITLRTVETDNELRKGGQTRDWLTRMGIKVEESAPRTQQQNGSGERSGGVVKEKIRILMIDSHLPSELWPEMGRTAVYLLNRTPKQRLAWKTPYESFFSKIPTAKEADQPRIGHMKMKDTIGEQTLEEIQGRLETLLAAEKLDQVMDPLQGPDELETPELNFESQIEDLPTESEAPNEPQTSKEAEYTQLRFEPIPTPPESPSASFLAHIGLHPGHIPEQDLLAINQAFYAGQMIVPIAKAKDGVLTKAKRSRYIRGKLKPRKTEVS
ncbi:retrotransposon hobase [Fusarium langsethiae]|uniref:Retrotransposon hobase n=1 Tax=Fusarium langsethiae TaxID=179993 RepID=A0A0M9EYJ0_FUSLA|nr:retrotransposon hobase [Fusarium langsethiae]